MTQVRNRVALSTVPSLPTLNEPYTMTHRDPDLPQDPDGDDVPMPPDDPARKNAPVKEPPKQDPPQRA